MLPRAVGTLLLLAALPGCHGGPTLADAREKLHGGEPHEALALARNASAATVKERLALHRVAFHASLSAGWSHEAAREYSSLRELSGHHDPTLLRRLGRSTLELGLNSSDPARRVAAAIAVARLQREERGEDRLAPALADRLPVVRATAVRALGASSGPRAMAALQAATSDPDPLVRRAALQTLHGSPTDDAHRPTLIALARHGLTDPSPDVRLAALDLADALGLGTGEDGLLDDVRRAVRNGSDAVSLRAARSLLTYDPALALEAWRAARHDRVRHLLPFTRALTLHADSGQRTAVRRDLRAASFETRLNACRGLTGEAAASLRGELLRLLREDPVGRIRLAALQALLTAGPAIRARAIGEALEQDHPAARRLAFLARNQRTPWTTDELEGWLDGHDPVLAAKVADLLAERGGSRGQALLLRGLSHPNTRLACARALATSSADGLREAFLALLSDGDPRLRSLAAVGLLTQAEAEDRAVLAAALQRPERHADLSAAAALLSLEARLAAAPAAGVGGLPD